MAKETSKVQQSTSPAPPQINTIHPLNVEVDFADSSIPSSNTHGLSSSSANTSHENGTDIHDDHDDDEIPCDVDSMRKAFEELKMENRTLKNELAKLEQERLVAKEEEISKLRARHKEELYRIGQSMSDRIVLPPPRPGSMDIEDDDWHYKEWRKANDIVQKTPDEPSHSPPITPACVTFTGTKIRKMVSQVRIENAYLKRKGQVYHELYTSLVDRIEKASRDREKMEIVAIARENMLDIEQECLRRLTVILENLEKKRIDTTICRDLELDLMIERRARQALMKKIQVLELSHQRERHDALPLFQIGVAVRLRYLEYSKKDILGSSRESLDQDVIDRGNDAAHGGNAVADAALFSARQAPDLYRGCDGQLYLDRDYYAVSAEDGDELFKALYGSNHSYFKERHGVNATRAIDAYATIKALKDDASLSPLRARAKSLMDELRRDLEQAKLAKQIPNESSLQNTVSHLESIRNLLQSARDRTRR